MLACADVCWRMLLQPTAKFRMAYDGTKWVNRVAFTIKGGEVPEVRAPRFTCFTSTKVQILTQKALQQQEEKTPDALPI